MPIILDMSGVRAQYGNSVVLHGIDIAVEKSKVTAMLGANGAGKTTTLRSICQMVKCTGNIRFQDQEMVGRKTEDVVRRGIAHVPEGRGTFTALSVQENLQLGAYAAGGGVKFKDELEIAFERFPILKKRRNQQAGTLSGGEQQMLAISRALMSKPKLLLLDEPSFGLAPMIVADIYATMRRVVKEEGVSLLLVEQNAKLALDIAHHVYLLENGRIVLNGSPAEIAGAPSIRQAYLGC